MKHQNRIDRAFRRVRERGSAALMPYFTLGYPSPSTSLEVVEAIAGAGADLIELGIPFSDPLADGPTIQHSTQVALEAGVTTEACLTMVDDLRQRGVSQPLILMGYFNPILQYGPDGFAANAHEAGADGLIIPDLPMEEDGELDAICRDNDLVLVRMVAPTSSDERIRAAAARSRGFLYLVSVTGVTGARGRLWEGIERFAQRVRRHTDLPLAVGFGISTEAQARSIGSIADGVIIGSALIDAVESADDKVRAASAFISPIKRALSGVEAGETQQRAERG